PPEPTARDTLFISSVIRHYGEIERVWCLIFSPGENTVIDSLPMRPKDGGFRFQTLKGLSGFEPGSVFRYAVFAEDREQAVFSSDTLNLRIPTLPDLSLSDLVLDGAENTFLRITVRNLGGESVTDARVRLACEAAGFSSEALLDIPGHGQSDFSFPFRPSPGRFRFSGTVWADSQRGENNLIHQTRDWTLEMDHFDADAQHGTGGWVGFPGGFTCFVPPAALTSQSALKIERFTAFDHEMETPSGAEGTAYRVHFLAGPGTSLSSPIQIRFSRSPGDSLRGGVPYRWDPEIRQWLYLDHEDQDSLVVSRSRFTGLFRLMHSRDRTGPRVEIQVQNQPFTPMSYIPKEARFSVHITDDSGVDPRSEAVSIYLGEHTVPPNQWIASDSAANIRSRIILFDAKLDPGEHRIRVEASDIHGNRTVTTPVVFRVAEKFSLQFLGNHPNPFRRETVFVYVLTDAADQASLKIYTVSGRMIRAFEDAGMGAPDYHEIVWDGTDAWGDEVANGVYFFRLRARQDGRMEEITGKIAKVR
ncbi:MAG TPA: hypothetical protein ENN17_10565, partial [bacterium]|nr:hypothetical protein [bacterium]